VPERLNATYLGSVSGDRIPGVPHRAAVPARVREAEKKRESGMIRYGRSTTAADNYSYTDS